MRTSLISKVILFEERARKAGTRPTFHEVALLHEVMVRYRNGTLKDLDPDRLLWPLGGALTGPARILVDRKKWASFDMGPLLSSFVVKEMKNVVELDKERLFEWLRPVVVDVVKLHENLATYSSCPDGLVEQLFRGTETKTFLDELERSVKRLEAYLSEVRAAHTAASFEHHAQSIARELDSLPDHEPAQGLVRRTRKYDEPFALRLFLSPVLRRALLLRKEQIREEEVLTVPVPVTVLDDGGGEYIFKHMKELLQVRYRYMLKERASAWIREGRQQADRIAAYVFGTERDCFDPKNTAQDYCRDPLLLNERYGADGSLLSMSRMFASRKWQERVGYLLFGTIKWLRFIDNGWRKHEALSTYFDLPNKVRRLRKKLWKAAGVTFLLYRLAVFLTSSLPVYQEPVKGKAAKVTSSQEYVIPLMKNLWNRFWSPSVRNYYDLWRVYSDIDRDARVPSAQKAMEKLGQNVDLNGDGVVDLPEMMEYADRISWVWGPFSARELEAARISTKYQAISQHNPLLLELLLEQTSGFSLQELENTLRVVNRIAAQNARLDVRRSPVAYMQALDHIIRTKTRIPYKGGTHFITEGLGSGKKVYADCDIYSFLHYGMAYERKAPVTLVHVPEHMFVRWVFAPGRHINFETTSGRVHSDAYIKKDNPDDGDCPDYMRTQTPREVFAGFYDLVHGHEKSALKNAEHSLDIDRIEKGTAGMIVDNVLFYFGLSGFIFWAAIGMLFLAEWVQGLWSEED